MTAAGCSLFFSGKNLKNQNLEPFDLTSVDTSRKGRNSVGTLLVSSSDTQLECPPSLGFTTDSGFDGILTQQDVTSSPTLMPPLQPVASSVCVISKITEYILDLPFPCHLSCCPSPLVSLLRHSPSSLLLSPRVVIPSSLLHFT